MVDREAAIGRESSIAISLARVAPVAAGISIVVGSLVLLGWAMRIETLQSVVPGLVSMKPNAALCFVLLGLGLLAATIGRGQRGLAQLASICAGFAALTGLVTLFEYAFDIAPGIDLVLFADRLPTPHTRLSGRMSPVTATNFVVLGTATILLARRTAWRIAQTCAALAGFIGFVALLGYLYRVESLYSLPNVTQIAAHTATTFILLALGVLGATSSHGWMEVVSRDSTGGKLARRLLPIVLIGPILLGGLRLAGQRAGLFGNEFGVALMVMSTVVVAAIFVHANARKVDAGERERERYEEQLRQAQKMEAVGRLAGGIAHDFNNMLSVILGYGELLAEELRDRPQARHLIDECLRAGQRAAALTNQLLAFSRKQVVQPTVLDLNAVVADIDRMLRRILGEDIDLATVLQSDLGRVHADRGQIDQVLLNLVVNARDAMPQGGRLTIETANVELDDAYVASHPGAKVGPHVMVAVSDTGHGMEAATREHIFEPFFTAKGVGRGTGLGLATVHGVVHQNGGSIWVYSELGRGTTFKLYWPCVGTAAALAETTATREENLRGHETILVVEDESMIRALEQSVLLSAGYEVIAAANPREALELEERFAGTIDMLLTDVVMPGMSGKLLADELVKRRPDVKVLYVSGYTDNAVVHHGLLDPDVAFLQKPFTPTVLRRKVREVLEATYAA